MCTHFMITKVNTTNIHISWFSDARTTYMSALCGFGSHDDKHDHLLWLQKSIEDCKHVCFGRQDNKMSATHLDLI